MEQKFDYQIEQITDPAILVRVDDEVILMMGELRVVTDDMVMTNRELLIEKKKSTPSFAALFEEDSYAV